MTCTQCGYQGEFGTCKDCGGRLCSACGAKKPTQEQRLYLVRLEAKEAKNG